MHALIFVYLHTLIFSYVSSGDELKNVICQVCVCAWLVIL